ncbi:MAG: SWIM zinc finger family protein [Chitinophagales bacterium]|nr:SWIM zinc finger family protein [Chitinophagales bacterium]
MFILTRDYLKKWVGATIFERGESYYLNGYVEKLVQRGNTFVGKVYGTYTYKVRFILLENGIETTCNCPYDDDCKHIVAVGLAIINNDFELDPNYIEVPDFMEKVYQKADKTQKEAFLREILLNDEKLRTKFLKFLKITPESLQTPTPIPPPVVIKNDQSTEIKIDIEKETISIFDKIVTFKMTPTEVREGKVHINKKPDPFDTRKKEKIKFSTVFLAEKINKIKTLLNQNQVPQAFRLFMAVSDVYYKQVYSVYYDNELIVDTFLDDCMNEIVKELNSTLPDTGNMFLEKTLSTQDTKQLIDEIVDNTELYPKYDFSYIAEPLLHFTQDHETATYACDIFLNRDFLLKDVATICLPWLKMLGRLKEWEAVALDAFDEGADVATDILQYYKEQQNKEQYYKFAKEAFTNHNEMIASLVADDINPADDRTFFIQVYEQLCLSNQSFEQYNILNTIWTKHEKDTFIKSLSKEPMFFAQILIQEQKITDLCDFILSYNLKDFYERSQVFTLVQLAIVYYPKEVLELAIVPLVGIIMNSKPTKHEYEDLARLLALWHNIQDTEIKKRWSFYCSELVSSTYMRHTSFRQSLIAANALPQKT